MEPLHQIHWGLFVMIVFLLLLNLLIAMMGDTYAKIAAIKNEWMRQWAKTLLITERGIPPQERLRQQDLYADRDRCSSRPPTVCPQCRCKGSCHEAIPLR